MPITHIPAQYPRHIPSLQPRMPQLLQSLMMNYMQQKYATQRQKDEWEEERKQATTLRTHQTLLAKTQYIAKKEETHTPVSNLSAVKKGDIHKVEVGAYDTFWIPREEEKKLTDAQWLHKETGLIKAGEGFYNPATQKFVKPGSETFPKTITGAWLQKHPKATDDELLEFQEKMEKFGKGYKPTTMEQALALRRAGASQIAIDMAGRRLDLLEDKFDITKEVTVIDRRTTLTTGKQDKAIFGAHAPQFNIMNKQNEVAYWDTSKWDNKTKILKLSKGAIDTGWTPKEVQNQANISGMTVEQVLKQIDELSK